MNKTLIQNDNLSISFIEDSDIEIMPFNDDTLTALGWLDSSRYPQGEFINILSFLQTIVPTEYQEKVGYWDSIEKGLGIYNVFLEDGNNE